MLDWDKCYEEGREFTEVSEILLDKIFDDNAIQQKSIHTVLDVGCGRGELMRQLKSRGLEVRGIDLSKYSADIVGDFMNYELGTFDIIFANKVIAFNNTKKFVEKVKKHLNPTGYFICISPVLYPKYKDEYSPHIKSISVDRTELETILKSSFSSSQVIASRYFGYYGEELTILCMN